MAASFFVVRLVATWGGGYGDIFFALGLVTGLLLVGAGVSLFNVARTGNGAGEAVFMSLGATVVLLVLGFLVGLRG
jgi:hypothetical protein